jgi:hypothetical protein
VSSKTTWQRICSQSNCPAQSYFLRSRDTSTHNQPIETITDPDIDAWIANESLIARGAEIGDLCEPTGNSKFQFLDPVLILNGHKYELELMYSNFYHACSPR